MIWLASALE